MCTLLIKSEPLVFKGCFSIRPISFWKIDTTELLNTENRRPPSTRRQAKQVKLICSHDVKQTKAFHNLAEELTFNSKQCRPTFSNNSAFLCSPPYRSKASVKSFIVQLCIWYYQRAIISYCDSRLLVGLYCVIIVKPFISYFFVRSCWALECRRTASLYCLWRWLCAYC